MLLPTLFLFLLLSLCFPSSGIIIFNYPTFFLAVAAAVVLVAGAGVTTIVVRVITVAGRIVLVRIKIGIVLVLLRPIVSPIVEPIASSVSVVVPIVATEGRQSLEGIDRTVWIFTPGTNLNSLKQF